MTNIEKRRYEVLVRVRAFGETHNDLFPADSLGGQAFEQIGVAVKQLGEAVSGISLARGGTRAKTQARAALIDRLEAIIRSAGVIAGGSPGFGDPFHLPTPRSDEALLATGRKFVQEADAVKARFLAFGMPETFVPSLSVLVDEFEQAIRSRQTGKERRAATRGSIEAALASGFEAVSTLDVIVANRLHDDPVTMAVWERERRVSVQRVKKDPSVAPDGTPAAARAGEAPIPPDPVGSDGVSAFKKAS